jgi:hypothetical protein
MLWTLKFLTEGAICLSMRKILAVMALLCGAISASAVEPQKWYSSGFEAGRAELAWTADVPILTINGKPVEIEGDGHEPLLASALLAFSEGGKPDYEIWIYKDRVFWPCS